MGYGTTGTVELPGAVEAALAALRMVVEAHPTDSVRRTGDDHVDVAGRAKVRFTARAAAYGGTELEHGWWGLRAPGAEERAHDLVVVDLVQRTRDAVAHEIARHTPGTSSGYVGTLLGGADEGRTVAVLFGPDAFVITGATTSVRLRARDLLELSLAPARDAAGALLTATTARTQHRVRLDGATTSLVTVELAPLREAVRPRPVVPAPRPVLGKKLTPIQLVREMADLAQLHHTGLIDADDYALAKADLLGMR